MCYFLNLVCCSIISYDSIQPVISNLLVLLLRFGYPLLDFFVGLQLQDLASTLIELWSLMNTSSEEQKRFDHVTCLISSSLDGVSKQGCLALDIIEQVILLYSRPICVWQSDAYKVQCFYSLPLNYLSFQTEAEVERLNVLKVSKMKELVFKRQNELEEIYRGVHMDVDSGTARQILISLMESGY